MVAFAVDRVAARDELDDVIRADGTHRVGHHGLGIDVVRARGELDATSSDGGAAVWRPQRLHDASHTMDTHRTPVITAPIG